jgi:hypothetical protein
VKSGWATSEAIGSSEIFERLHRGLTVDLILTHRSELMTCSSDAFARDVVQRNVDAFDHIPVMDKSDATIIGLFHAAGFDAASPPNSRIADHLELLSEALLLSPKARILDFLLTADERPCRIVVSDGETRGLVTLSDLQRLPVRAALFALITGFEIVMMEAIRRHYRSMDEWLPVLKPKRQELVQQRLQSAKRTDSFVDELLFTEFADKRALVRSFQTFMSKGRFEENLKIIEDLRNEVAHASNYAATPQRAREVCETVRQILTLKDQIAGL